MDKLPTVTSDIPRDLRLWLDRARELMTGSVKLVDLVQGRIPVPGSAITGTVPVDGTDPNGNCTVELPTTPINLTVSGGYRYILVEWESPPYCGHAYTEIWAAQSTPENLVPTFEDADSMGITAGTMFVHAVGNAETWYYWVRNVNINGLRGPISGIDGVATTSAVDVAALLAVLTDQLSQDQLQQSLADRIDLIDAPDSVEGSVNARLSDIVDAYLDGDATITALLDSDYFTSTETGAAIASAVDVLATQLRGSYTGTDLDAVTTGLIYSERTARTTQDSALSLQISLLSAGADSQFDFANIWYFDSTVEGWTAGTAGTSVAWSDGWLVLDSDSGSVSDPCALSPSGLEVPGATYPQVRARIKKVGSPTWEGKCYFLTSTDGTWNETKMASISEPSYDDSVALITFNMPTAWATSTVVRIRLDLATAVTESDYFEIDWVAIGRPSPGASSAQLLAEETARASADSALASTLSSLSATVTGLDGDVTAAAAAIDVIEAAVNDTDTGLEATATRVSQLATTITADQLVHDGYFTQTALDGVLGAWWSVNDDASVLPTGGPSGSAALKINAAGIIRDSYNRFAGDTIFIPIKSGETLYLSYDYFASTDFDGGNGGLHVGFSTYDLNGNNLSYYPSLSPPSSTFELGAWKSVSGEITLTKTNVAYCALRCSVRSNATTGYALFSRIELTRTPQRFVAVEQSSKITGLEAQYTVKVDVNGYVSGFGLASTVVNGQPTSAFRIRTDSFSITAPGTTSPAPIAPFVYQATATTVNGVSVPVGLYLDAAFIKNGTITAAKIGNATIDNGKIISLSAGKLTAGAIAVDSYVRSSNYVAGSSGWNISGNGVAELNTVTVRGTVYASAGSFAGTLNAAIGNFKGEINVGSFTGYAWPPSGGTGGHLSKDGLLVGNANDGRYFMVDKYGNVYSPGFQIVDGAAIFSGSVNTGSYTSYNWPASGSGAHLSKSGLLIGNANGGGKYFQIYSGGSNPLAAYIATNIPFINTININDAQITTLKVAGNAITAPASAAAYSDLYIFGTSSGFVLALGIGMQTIGMPCFITGLLNVRSNVGAEQVPKPFQAYIRVYRSDGGVADVWWSGQLYTGPGGAGVSVPVMMAYHPPAGWTSFYIGVTCQEGTVVVGARALYVSETRR